MAGLLARGPQLQYESADAVGSAALSAVETGGGRLVSAPAFSSHMPSYAIAGSWMATLGTAAYFCPPSVRHSKAATR